MHPYSSEYQAIPNIPVVTGATSITDQETGEVLILVVNEALYFGNRMDHSLINPNQLRHHGIQVQDNPFDSDRILSIQGLSANDNEVVIPLNTKGTTILFESRTPTQQELDECTWIYLTSHSEWNPHTISFPSQTISSTSTSLPPPIQSTSTCSALRHTIYDPSYFSQRILASASQQVDIPTPRSYVSSDRHSYVSAENLSDRWLIGPKQAAKTVEVTTQKGTRSAILPLSRRYRGDLFYQKKRLNIHLYTDTYYGRCKSLQGNNCAQIFGAKNLFVQAYPMATKSDAGKALRSFINEWGVPAKLTFDGAPEQFGKGTEFMKQIMKHGIEYHVSEPHRPDQNAAEGVIREVRRKWFRIMMRKGVPRRLWDYGIQWVCEITQRTSNSHFALAGRTPFEAITGETPDISEYLDFGFYDRVWFKENAGLGEKLLGRWLGVAHRIGNAMNYFILKDNGRVISRSTVQRVTNLELRTEEVKEQTKAFDSALEEATKDAAIIIENDSHPHDWGQDLQADQDFLDEFYKVVSNEEIKDADSAEDGGQQDKGTKRAAPKPTPDTAGDTYLNAEIVLPRLGHDHLQYARVTKRSKDEEGRPIGTANANPILDTRSYVVEFMDGHEEAFTANLIAEHMFSVVDQDGHRQQLMDEIIDHRVDRSKAINHDDSFTSTSKGAPKKRKKTTKGWELLIKWKDGSTNWIALKDMKESFAVETAEYSKSRDIHNEPAFAWWVPHVLKKKKIIIAKIKSAYWQTTHKYGMKIPKTVQEALAIDKENGDTLWWDSIIKEMDNVRIAFEEWKRKEADIPKGYQKIRCHLIFDIKLSENFRRKARFVAGGHTTSAPSSITYSSVVSRDSVRIALTIAALNDLKVVSCDIQNAYLTAPCREKIYTIAGPEFGSDEGSIMIVKRALYGLKSSGAAFHSYLAEILYDLGYKPSKGDPDVWLRPAVKPDGHQYYEYLLTYVDDIILVSHDPDVTMKGLQEAVKLKNDKFCPPDSFLGSQLTFKEITGQPCWCMTSNRYITEAIKTLEQSLQKKGAGPIPNKASTPLPLKYHPELESSPELNAADTKLYQEMIGILRWSVELGRIDIALEVSLMSSHMAAPRIGHLQQLLHMLGYLKRVPKLTLAFDPRHPEIDEQRFHKYDWHDFYRDAKEEIPHDFPSPRGHEITTHCFVDASHASDLSNRRSQTGILIFLNRAPILWYSKRQNTVESSTFGSEFVAMKIAVEMIQGLRYKLRSFGIPINEATNVFCDNDAVCKNTSLPHSTLNKKHNSIAYHKCREAAAAGIIRVTKEDTTTNLADALTKLKGATERERIFFKFMY